MRVAAIVFGVLGVLSEGFLAFKWISDLNSPMGQMACMMIDEIEKSGKPMSAAQAADLADFQAARKAAYLLAVGAVLGVVGVVLTGMGKGQIAGGLMVVGAVVPVALAPKAIIFTALLLIGGALAFLSKPAAGGPAYPANPAPPAA